MHPRDRVHCIAASGELLGVCRRQRSMGRQHGEEGVCVRQNEGLDVRGHELTVGDVVQRGPKSNSSENQFPVWSLCLKLRNYNATNCHTLCLQATFITSNF